MLDVAASVLWEAPRFSGESRHAANPVRAVVAVRLAPSGAFVLRKWLNANESGD